MNPFDSEEEAKSWTGKASDAHPCEKFDTEEKRNLCSEGLNKAVKHSIWQSSVWQSSVWEGSDSSALQGAIENWSGKNDETFPCNKLEEEDCEQKLKSAMHQSVWQSSVWQSSVWQSSVWQSSVWQ